MATPKAKTGRIVTVRTEIPELLYLQFRTLTFRRRLKINAVLVELIQQWCTAARPQPGKEDDDDD